MLSIKSIITLSSKTGVSIVTAPCFLKTLVMVEKTRSRIAISLSLWSLVPWSKAVCISTYRPSLQPYTDAMGVKLPWESLK